MRLTSVRDTPPLFATATASGQTQQPPESLIFALLAADENYLQGCLRSAKILPAISADSQAVRSSC